MSRSPELINASIIYTGLNERLSDVFSQLAHLLVGKFALKPLAELVVLCSIEIRNCGLRLPLLGLGNLRLARRPAFIVSIKLCCESRLALFVLLSSLLQLRPALGVLRIRTLGCHRIACFRDLRPELPPLSFMSIEIVIRFRLTDT